jgi:hypothetical protein
MNFEWSIAYIWEKKNSSHTNLSINICVWSFLYSNIDCALSTTVLITGKPIIVLTNSLSLFSAGDVRINWTPVLKNGFTLKSGDVVSVSGMGRLKVI